MTQRLSEEALGLIETIPVIRRARGWRLYGADKARILDMYLDGGRSILGRRNGISGRTEKESIDRGLDSAFPSFWRRRLEKDILTWLPGYEGIRFYPSEVEALLALAARDEDFAKRLEAGTRFPEALDSFAKSVFVEAPFSGYRTDAEKNPEHLAFEGCLAIAILPLAPAWSFGVVLEKAGGGIAENRKTRRGNSGRRNLGSEHSRDEAASAPIPAIKLAAAARSLSDFLAFAANYGEKQWSAMDPFIVTLFKRSGPWLYPTYPRKEHGRVFAACLGKGILISPDYDMPSLVPGEFDAGEAAPLKTILP
ncbi:MAG TPA: hypothetical protein VN445_14690 [Rectinemataceae bacterium]|nr:hypothetical protein [Rectinemataceae bacterium]